MLIIKLTDGSREEIKNPTGVLFAPIGVTFNDQDSGMLQCITYDKIQSIDYSVIVTEAMKKESKELQFIKSSDRPPQRLTASK